MNTLYKYSYQFYRGRSDLKYNYKLELEITSNYIDRQFNNDTNEHLKTRRTRYEKYHPSQSLNLELSTFRNGACHQLNYRRMWK